MLGTGSKELDTVEIQIMKTSSLSKIVELIEIQSRNAVARGRRGGNGEMLVKGDKVSVMQDD